VHGPHGGFSEPTRPHRNGLAGELAQRVAIAAPCFFEGSQRRFEIRVVGRQPDADARCFDDVQGITLLDPEALERLLGRMTPSELPILRTLSLVGIVLLRHQ